MRGQRTILHAVLVAAMLVAGLSGCRRRYSDVQVPKMPRGTTLPRFETMAFLIVSIDYRGRRTIDGEPVASDEDLRARFAAVASANPNASVAIHADASVPYEQITTVMLLAGTAGMANVVFFVRHADVDPTIERDEKIREFVVRFR